MNEIIGNTIATPTPTPDWNQTNESGPGYIKNKPVVDQTFDGISTNAQSGLAVSEAVDFMINYVGDAIETFYEFQTNAGAFDGVQSDWDQVDETKSDYIKNKPLENGNGENSIQQSPEVEYWTPTNARITDFLEAKNYTTEDGAIVNKDENDNFLVGAYGINSAMLGAKGQTVGGKTFVAGSKGLAFENNTFVLGNATFAGGKHSGALNNETCALENSALAINNGTTAGGKSSFSSGNFTNANGEASDAGGEQTVADGDFSFSRGMFGKATGKASAVIGDNCIASDNNALATGSNTVAGNVNTFSSGHMTFAFGEQAHSENCHTFAGVRGFQILSKTTWVTELTDDSETLTIYLDSCEGLEVGDVITVVTSRVFLDMAPIVAIKSEENKIVVSAPLDMPVLSNGSIDIMFVRKKPWLGNKVVGHHTHSEGYGTIASTDAQHVQGKYNYVDIEGKYAHIVGNGKSDNNRSNAHTIDWDGNGWFAGDVEAQAIVLVSPNGGKFRLTVSDDGELITTLLTKDNDEGSDDGFDFE